MYRSSGYYSIEKPDSIREQRNVARDIRELLQLSGGGRENPIQDEELKAAMMKQLKRGPL